MRRARSMRANIIAVEQVPPRARPHVRRGRHRRAQWPLFSLTQMVEKPPRESAPSNLIITGRYILQPEIFDMLAAQKRGAGGEIQLTDAMIELARSQPFYGLKFEGAASIAARRWVPCRQCRLRARARGYRSCHARRARTAPCPSLACLTPPLSIRNVEAGFKPAPTAQDAVQAARHWRRNLRRGCWSDPIPGAFLP